VSVPEEKWFEVVAYFKPEEGKEVVHQGDRIFICGNFDKVTIAQITEVYGNEPKTVARIKSAQAALKVLGVDKGLVVTDSVRFMKLREVVDQDVLAQLNEGKKMVMH